MKQYEQKETSVISQGVESNEHLLLFFYVVFNSQGHIETGSLQVEETSAYCTVNHRASASNYQLPT